MEQGAGYHPDLPAFTMTEIGRALNEHRANPDRLSRQVGTLLAEPEQHDLRNYVNRLVNASPNGPAANAGAAVIIRLFQVTASAFPVVCTEHLPASDDPATLDQFVEDSNPKLAEAFRMLRANGRNPIADFCFTTTARSVYVALARACQRKPNS
jgi:hypothetical protein